MNIMSIVILLGTISIGVALFDKRKHRCPQCDFKFTFKEKMKFYNLNILKPDRHIFIPKTIPCPQCKTSITQASLPLLSIYILAIAIVVTDYFFGDNHYILALLMFGIMISSIFIRIKEVDDGHQGLNG